MLAAGRNIKSKGQVYSPGFVVDYILDLCDYRGTGILRKHIIEISCGTGAFLTHIVARYCLAAEQAGLTAEELRSDLQEYVHGIDINPEACEACRINLDTVASEHGVTGVEWDLICTDALTVSSYDERMDYVVGNPPYVRVHNLTRHYEDVKRYSFAASGMTDMYLAFYELGLRMLNERGMLCYITPVSWLTSLAGAPFRRFIEERKCWKSYSEFGHFQPFDVTTYTAVVQLSKDNRNRTISYFAYDADRRAFVHVDDLSYEEISFAEGFRLLPKRSIEILRRIKSSDAVRRVQVKNGFATLADKVFIGELPFEELTIDILKASTGKWSRALFPYTAEGTPLTWRQVAEHRRVAQYLLGKEAELQKGRTREQNPEWYLYGRTQALRDVCREKTAINNLIRSKDSIRLERVGAGCGVYSGLYIIGDVGFETLRAIIISDEFVEYVSLLKNFKNGGYYTFSSRELEQYLNYKLSTAI